MKTEVYWFSATGNSLKVARDLAAGLNGTCLSIASLDGLESVRTDADAIGIVFPVYFLFNGGVPPIVKRFARKLEPVHGRFVFAVCTFGMLRGSAIRDLSRLLALKGIALSAGYAVPMPYNYTDWGGSFKEIPVGKRQKMFRAWERKCDTVVERVKAKKGNRLESDSAFRGRLLDGLGITALGRSHYLPKAGCAKDDKRSFDEVFGELDRGFNVDETCDGCGICAKICPVRNIRIERKSQAIARPVWERHCEQCFACLHWCPKKSLRYGAEAAAGWRYHHPEIARSDMINKFGVEKESAP